VTRTDRLAGGHHEMDFNLQLAKRLLRDEGHTASSPLGPRLYLNAAQRQLARDFRAEYDAEKFVFLHPGSGGSALDWEPERFATVANVLAAALGVPTLGRAIWCLIWTVRPGGCVGSSAANITNA
jgi:hypothetical protein